MIYVGIRLQNQYVLKLKLCGTIQLGLKLFVNGPNNAKKLFANPGLLIQRSRIVLGNRLYCTQPLSFIHPPRVARVSEFATNLGRTVTNFRVGDGNARRSGPALCCAAPGAARARRD